MHSCVWKVRRKTSFLQSETSCLSQEAHRKQPAMQQPQLQLESRFEFSCFSSSEVKALVWPPPLQGPLSLQRGAWLAPKVMRKLWSDCLWMANLTADSLSPSLGTTGWLSSSAYAHRAPVQSLASVLSSVTCRFSIPFELLSLSPVPDSFKISPFQESQASIG